jgi:vancomycin permeability regulator SanA
MRKTKILAVVFLVGIFLICFGTFWINQDILTKSKPYIYQNINQVPEAQVALVLGAKVYRNGIMSPMFIDRIDTAVELYNKGEVSKILVSGDHTRKNYDEITPAREYILTKQIPLTDILFDSAGINTYNSFYRARNLFKVKSVVAITQNFHLSRAVFIARSLGLDACGLSADKHLYPKMWFFESREVLARVKAFLNVKLGAKPKYSSKAGEIF